MVGKSGKVIDTVHQEATAIWEVTQIFEEGHAGVCGLFATR
jgi:hypothetical protein